MGIYIINQFKKKLGKLQFCATYYYKLFFLLNFIQIYVFWPIISSHICYTFVPFYLDHQIIFIINHLITTIPINAYTTLKIFTIVVDKIYAPPHFIPKNPRPPFFLKN